ncbi:MAG: hypothetical protein K2J46_10465 [Muribaculaceae bacterium]|nr:hypothetical protein [Muribaculaceae bacterium]
MSDTHAACMISKTWGKEDELKQLKSELGALDLKITAEPQLPYRSPYRNLKFG